MGKQSPRNRTRSSTTEDSKNWYAEVFRYLERQSQRVLQDGSDLEARYLETCQLALATCEELGISLPVRDK